MRVRKGRGFTLRHEFLDETEEAPLSLSSVTATLYDSAGVEVTTVAAVDGVENWSASFPTQPLGRYRVDWDGDTGYAIDSTYVEVVSGFLFTVPQARNSDEYLKDATAFPASEIIDYRQVVEEGFEQITGRSFTTRLVDAIHVGDGTGEFVALIPDAQEVEAVWLDGVAVEDVSEWRVNRLGKVTAPDLISEGVIVRIAVRYGFTSPPADIARAGMIWVRHLMAAEDSGIPDRATTWQPDEGGTFRLATPGIGPWETGIPEVDSTLKRYTLDTVLAVYAGG